MGTIARGQITIARVEDGQKGATGAAVVYRGPFSATAIYYNNAIRRDVVKYGDNFYIYKGVDARSGIWIVTNWENFGGQYESVATELILAENANLGGFIFSGGKLISQKGTINGVESSAYGNPDFVPYITLDGTNGKSQIYNGEFYGSVRTLFYSINATNCQSLGNNRYKVTDKTNLSLGSEANGIPPIVVLPNDKSFLGKTININNPCRPPFTKMDLMYMSSVIVSTESGEGIFYGPFLGSISQIDTMSYVNHAYQIEYLSGMLSFLCVPRSHYMSSDSVSWVCTNYPDASEGGSSGSGSGNVSTSGTLTSGYLIVGGGSKSILASQYRPTTILEDSATSVPTGKAVVDYVTANAVKTSLSTLAANAVILGAGLKTVKSSGMTIEQVITGGTTKIPTSSAVKKYVDSVAGAGGGSQWFNIYNYKGSSGIIYTVIENWIGDMHEAPDAYRIVLLKYRKQHGGGRKWSMPMFNYELYSRGMIRALPPNAIAENNSWWPISYNPIPWFSATGDKLTDVISLSERYSADHPDSPYSWSNTRNKKMKVGVAVYKFTGEGKIGWHRCSNIAFVELYKQGQPGMYSVNMMP